MDKMLLFKKDGTAIYVEVVVTFKLEKFNNSNYVIYKLENEFYGAKYTETSENTVLNANLSEDEKKELNIVFENFSKSGVIEC